jgi:hypothetical protein
MFLFCVRLGLCDVKIHLCSRYNFSETLIGSLSSCHCVHSQKVRLFQYGMEGNKEPFRAMPVDEATFALQQVINPANHPILIHCNEGKVKSMIMLKYFTIRVVVVVVVDCCLSCV